MLLRLIFFLTILLTQLAQAQLQSMSYEEAQQVVANPSATIRSSLNDQAGGHMAYSFLNANGEESVDYVGQTFRQVLIHDIKLLANSIARGEFAGQQAKAFQTLDSIYNYKVDQIPATPKAVNGRSRHLVTAKTSNISNAEIYEGAFYSSVYPRTTSLKVKTAGVDNKSINSVIHGWNSATVNGVTIDTNGDGKKSPEEFIKALMQGIAVNAASSQKDLVVNNPGQGTQKIRNATVTADGIDLAQLLQKVLHGAVSFSQATSDYLSVDLAPGKGLTADNANLLPNKPYTTLQHHWDEAFGYFGAARDYNFYSDSDIKNKLSRDSFDEEDFGASDGEISLEREKNFALAINAAKRDLGVGGSTDFTKVIFESFVKGRHLIQHKPSGYLRYAQALGVVASVEWEKVIAATTIHYINALLKDYDKVGSSSFKFTDFAKHYGEMKGFALAFQFSPVSPMSSSEFSQLHSFIGDAPALPGASSVSGYKSNLVKARNLLGSVYGFSNSNVGRW